MKLNHRQRLTATYIVIIMTLSFGFSILFYNNSIGAAENGLNQQMQQLRERIGFNGINPNVLAERIRQDQLNTFKADLIGKLVFLNLVMFAGGCYVGYYLAKKSLEPLEEALATQARFSSDAAHELRTPLTSIKTEIEVALRSKKLSTEDAKEVLDSTLEEVNGLETLTTALLRLSTYDQTSALNESVSVESMVQKAYERIEKQAKDKQITFELPKNKHKVIGDKDQLTEAFVVLFDNAIKYGKEEMSVKVSYEEDGSNLVISVKDEGIGISKKDLPHVFERFYRAEQSRGKATAPGHGLGLSLAEAVAIAHNGSISVESDGKNGTTFQVVLPLAAASS